eukprot:748733-Hanusia_phi.AAC.3
MKEASYLVRNAGSPLLADGTPAVPQDNQVSASPAPMPFARTLSSCSTSWFDLSLLGLEAFSFAPAGAVRTLSSSMQRVPLIQRARLSLRGGNGLRMMADGPRGNNVLCEFCSDVLAFDVRLTSMPSLDAKRGQQDGILGDCPYTHKAQMAMKAKDLQYEVCLVNLAEKPKWFLELNPKGTVPTYVTGEDLVDEGV